MISAQDSDRGREAARDLWKRGLAATQVDDPLTTEFAQSALAELELLQHGTAGVLREVLDGAQMSAEQLNVESFHGLIEVIQNADDLHATEVRIAFRQNRGHSSLLITHDGDRVRLQHVIAMTLAFVSTKRDDPRAKGRFGIGLKTLGRLGESLAVHCSPYDFIVAGNSVRSSASVRPIPGFYDPSSSDTLLEVQLRSGFDVEELHSWFANLGPSELCRRYKAMGATTPIGVAVPKRSADRGQLYAGLPLGIPTHLPISLNAQFDIDTARQAIQHERLNEWLLEQAGELAAAVALDRLDNAPDEAWRTIPLRAEQDVPGDPWLSKKLASTVESIQNHVRRSFRIEIQGESKRLRELAYEAKALEGLIEQREVTGIKPKFVLLPTEARDVEGRWREVLPELGGAEMITVAEAITLFDWDDNDLGHHDVQWFIRMARAALDEDLGDTLWHQRSILTKDDCRIVPPMPHLEGTLLLRSDRQNSLASRLGLTNVIHPAYLSRQSHAVVVREWLEEHEMLRDVPDAESTLRALAARDEETDSVSLNDVSVRLLRDAFEEVTSEISKELGPDVGRAIAVQVQRREDGKRVLESARPIDAYLPASIEDRKNGWSAAAGHTPGIRWIHPRYEKLLRRAGNHRGQRRKQRGLAARALFRLLGAEVAPRLVEPVENETRHDDRASPIVQERLAPSQREALAGLNRYATHLKHERLSPDLSLVLRDIQKERGLKRRCDRAKALISTLEQEWTRLYADHLDATAVYSKFTWWGAGEIPTNWIANLMDQAWLTNEAGRLRSPRELAVRTPATVAFFGDDRERFARELDESHALSPVVRALRIDVDPQVSTMIDQLATFRKEGGAQDVPRLELLYAGLANACKKGESCPDDLVGDLTVRMLRARFGLNKEKPGLIYANRQWLAPAAVYLGGPIFGDRRAFISEKSAADRLWRTLRLARPSVSDCIDVLAEVAQSTPDRRDEQTLVNTYRYLDTKLQNARARDHQRLRNLPLWTGIKWSTTRPVYVKDDIEIAKALSTHIDVWQLPLAADLVPNLIAATGATVLDQASFTPIVHQQAFVEGATLERQFIASVELLRDWLARHDRDLSEAHSLPWEDLATPRIAIDPNLELELRIYRREPIAIHASAHVTRDPLTFYFASAGAAGEYETGGRLLASFFTTGDRDKLALAWSDCWTKAAKGDRGAIALAEDTGDGATLETLYAQADQPSPRKPPARPTPKKTLKPAWTDNCEELPVRKLKTLEGLTGKTVDLIHDGTASSKNKNGRRGLRTDLPSGKPIGERSTRAPQSAPLAYSDEDKEELALQVLQFAINGEAAELRDYHHLRGVGADALDKLRRYFEIKSSYGALPDEVTLTANEADRAFREGDKFFLAVISGLEEGYETVVKIIPNPLRNLELKRNTSVTLGGIRDQKSAIEVRFPGASSNGSHSG